MNYIEMVKNHKPYNEQEENDKKLMLEYIDTFDDVLTRNNSMCHFTVSNWIVNKERTKVLMVYHNIYNSWAWSGGHADGDEDLVRVALKEANEETGLTKFKVLSEDALGIQILTVDGHVKRGKYVSSHVHLDCSVLIEADEKEALIIKEDENSGVQWVDIDKVLEYTTEEKMKPIYSKLIDKIKKGKL